MIFEKSYSRRIHNGSLLSLTQEICWNFSEIYSLNAEMKQQWFQWTRHAFISKQNVCLVSWSPFLDVTNSGNLLTTFTITSTLLIFNILQWNDTYINQYIYMAVAATFWWNVSFLGYQINMIAILSCKGVQKQMKPCPRSFSLACNQHRLSLSHFIFSFVYVEQIWRP